MRPRALVSLAAGAALLLSAGRASAEQDPGVRFRGGGAVVGGLLIVPSYVTAGHVGLEIQVGAQFNNLVAGYLVGSTQFIGGNWGGSNSAIALVLELLFKDTISVGVGPEVSNFSASPPIRSPELTGAGGPLYGGRLNVAWCPDSLRLGLGRPQVGLTFGAGIHLLRSGAGFLSGPRNSPGRFVLLPMLTFGFRSF
jgi:hypothetical protein